MFFGKRQREIDKLISANADDENPLETPAVIDVNAASRDMIFSAYGYSGDKLNPEFCDYIFDKAKNRSVKGELAINIHTDADISADEVRATVKNHFGAEYLAAKRELKRLSVISIIMTALGVLTLAVMILLNHFFDNFYVNTVVEIAAWVFIWEAVDYFFLQRPVTKGRCLLIQRIYTANIAVLPSKG